MRETFEYRQPTYEHEDAYRLMRYASRDGQTVEWIWNSRDGKAPAGIVGRDGKTEMRRVGWFHAPRLLDYRPQPGERIVVDMSPEQSRQAAIALVGKYWDQPASALRRVCPSPEVAVERLLASPFAPFGPEIVPACEAGYAARPPGDAPTVLLIIDVIAE